ncbi:MAG TPA: hypothetical protein VGM27_24850 [Acidobacteriaceae bacterium]|jgi:hypothetical protein
MFLNQELGSRTGAASRWCKGIFIMLALSIGPLAAAYAQSPALAVVPTAPAQASNATTQAPAPNATVPIPAHPPARRSSYFRTEGLNPHARDFYQLVWGIDMLKVKSVESGQMIRFTYLVRDGRKAAQLNDKKATPYLIDEKARVKLIVPTMEKVGQLRQSSTPESGRSYWMVFSNKGKVVKPGDSVSIVIGRFHADGLVVQ